MSEGEITSGDFHEAVQDRIREAVAQALADTRFDWRQIAPILDLARQHLAGEVRETAQIRLHAVRAEADQWVEAEEAFVGIAAGDPAHGPPWLSETRWLSQIVLAENEPDQVRRIVRAMERSVARIHAWLAERDRGTGTEPAVPRP